MPLIFPGNFDFQVKSITNYLSFFNVLLRAYSESGACVSLPPAAAGREGERSFSFVFCFDLVATVKCNNFASKVQSHIPCDCDSGFDAFVSGTSLWMYSYGAYRGFTSFGRKCNIVMDGYGFNADGLSGPGNTAIDSS